MKICFNIDMSALRIGAVRASADFSRNNKKLLWLLEALVKCNVIWLESSPGAPLLYESGVRYKREPIPSENWLDIPHVLKQGHGDCEDLAAWRVAELRKMGIAAKCYLKWYSKPSKGITLYHVQVMHSNQIEDPSKILGMEGKV